jgi:hypothetical protein
MARGDIRQRISLEGGEEVRRQLAQMGRAGEEAIRAMGRAVHSANTGLGSFAATVAATRAHMAGMQAAFAGAGDRLGHLHGRVQNFGSAMRASAATILPFNTNMLAMAAALTAALAPLALFAQAKKAALATDDLVDVAENLKITTEELVALRQVSEAGGGAFDLLEKAMQKGNRTLGEAAAKTKGLEIELGGQVTALRGGRTALEQYADGVDVLRGAQKALTADMDEYVIIARLAGTTVQNLAKMSPIDRLLAEGRAIGMVKNETQQARLANAAWGKTYADMLPALRDAEKLLKPTIARVREFKQGVSETEKVMSEGFLQAMARMNTAMGRISTFLGGTLGTVMVPVFVELERVIVANRVAIEAFALSTAAKLMPVVTDFVALVRGANQLELKTDFVKGLVSAFEQVKTVASIAFEVIKTGFLVVADVLAPIAAGINAVFGTQLTGTTLAAAAAVLYFVGAFNLLAAAIGVVVAGVAAFGAIPVAIGAALALLLALWFKHRDQVAEIVRNLWALITDTFNSGFTAITQGWTDFFAFFSNAWASATATFTANVSTMLGWLQSLIDLARAAASAVASAFGAGGGAPAAIGGRAGGGYIRGPGTSVSDSILARLSDGEYVIRAAAVKHFGVGMFEAMNRLHPPKFAMGGLVDAMNTSLMPRRRSFASGGLVAAGAGSGGRPVHLHLDGASFALRGEQDVVEALGKHARSRRVRSGGRAPSWVG